ncbi:MAG TPA: dockerin type I repeat-containing protein [Bacillota bacterium]|nr:dockerin type I repeat-containing protein [Bacillota bacterium]HOK68303.1 dockerin type I repeat-containing protein [Bacillota bacterium]HPP84517.1 dockerin type I repeat-containing protein [Bacillota bacterium]
MRTLKRIAAFICSTVMVLGALSVLPSSAIEESFRPTVVKEKYLYGIPERTTPEKLKSVLPGAVLPELEQNQDIRYIRTGDTMVIGDKSYTVVILGDVDSDGYITSLDYQKVKMHYLGTYTITGEANLLAACDDDLDGKIKAVTYLMIKRHVLGNYNMNMDYTGDESGWTSGWH